MLDTIIHGVDVSYVQGEEVDWAAAKESEYVDFVFSRASYGANPANDDGTSFAYDHDRCKAVGLPFGAYHFWIATDDAGAQATTFLAAVDGRQGTLRPMIDVEEESLTGGGANMSLNEKISRLADFLARIRTAFGCTPIIYTNADTWDYSFSGSADFSGHPLWVASYGTPPGKPIMPQGWRDWTLHQYTGHGQIPGIGLGSNPIDCSILRPGLDFSALRQKSS